MGSGCVPGYGGGCLGPRGGLTSLRTRSILCREPRLVCVWIESEESLGWLGRRGFAIHRRFARLIGGSGRCLLRNGQSFVALLRLIFGGGFLRGLV